MRSKEEANDYRYFPDPDLLPLVIDETFINKVRLTLPELPQEKAERFKTVYQLSEYDAKVLTSSKELADFYEATTKASGGNAKLTANWVMGDFMAALNKENLELTSSPITANQLGGLIKRIVDNTISGKIAKTVFEAMWQQEGDADHIIEKHNLKQVTDTSAIEKIIDTVIANNPAQVADYKAGKDKLFGFFVGLVMKESKGKANPAQVNELLKKKLEE
jgi:aspartyl-tRNA(Asn)/glutamyl-tRNA(Gln) amidotransferase subunit B